MRPRTSTLEKALGLLSLPREIGKHPEDGEMIIAGIGRFGSYVKLGKTYANLETGDDVLNIGLNRAVTLIAEKKLNPGKGRRFGADPGRSLGDHPDKGGPVVAKNGRYGPYVSHDGVNATITGGKTHEDVTLEEAVALIDARIEAGGGKKRKPAQKAKAKDDDAAESKKSSKAKPKAKAKEEEDASEETKKPAKAKTKAKPKVKSQVNGGGETDALAAELQSEAETKPAAGRKRKAAN